MTSSNTPTDPLVGNFTPRHVRIQGGLLLFLGAALAIGVSVILFNIAPSMLQPGVAVGGSTFTGTLEYGRAIIVLLSWVILLGTLFAIVGIQQLKTGTRMKALLYPTLAVAAIGIIGIWYFRGLLF